MKRIRYFDLLRVLCFCMVIFFHMLVQVYIDGMFELDAVYPYYANANMHLGTLSVAVFFMLSGASLITGTKDHIDYKQFYIKRFVRLLFPFYFVNICWFIIRAVRAKSLLALISGIAPWKIVLGILGIDEWLTLYGVTSFSQGIGEWFLGCLIILYVLFPLFRKLMLKSKAVFLTVVVLIYVFVIYNYSSSVPIYQSIWIKGCEFIFGMYLGMYWEKINKKVLVISLPVVIFYFTSKTTLSINIALSITILASAFFITVSFTENILQKSTYFYKCVAFLSGCSYELFLVHHLVIYNFTPFAKPYTHNNMHVLIMFVMELAIMGILALAVKCICDPCIKYLNRRLLPSIEKQEAGESIFTSK